MRKAILFLFLVLSPTFIHAQNAAIDVTDQQSWRIKGDETKELYFGFAAGDQIVFNMEVIEGTQLKNVEILEYPNISKFSQAKPTFVNETLSVSKEGIYKFTLSSPFIGGKTVKLKIQRIPANNLSANFNTSIEWRTKNDTNYVNYTIDSIVGYDTTYTTYYQKEVVKTDTIFQELFSKQERVHSATDMNGNTNKTCITITLPTTIKSDYQKTEVISWAYWIGVGSEGMNAFEVAKEQFLTTVTVEVAKKNLLYGLAIGAISYLAIPNVGDNIQYWFIQDYTNAQLFMSNSEFRYILDKGDGVAAKGRVTSQLQGTLYLGLYNDNIRDGIDVNVKVGAVSLITSYEDKEYKRQKITERKVTLNKVQMDLTPVKYPVILPTDPNAIVTYASNNISSNTQTTTTTTTSSTNKFSIGDSVAFEVSELGYIIGAIKTIDGENLLVEYFDKTNKKVYDKKAMKDVMFVSSKNGSNSNNNPSGAGNETVNGFYVGEDVLFLSDSYIPAQNVPAKIIKFSSDKLNVDVEYSTNGKTKTKTIPVSKLSKK
jgi:hypothetical protein